MEKTQKKDVKKTETKPVKVAEVKKQEAKMSAGERFFNWLAPEPDWKGNLKVWGKRLAKVGVGGLLVGGAYALGKNSNHDDGESATTTYESEPYEAPTEE